MSKLMISLSNEAEKMVRGHIKKSYHGRVGSLSIFFEQLVRDYFVKNPEKEEKP